MKRNDNIEKRCKTKKIVFVVLIGLLLSVICFTTLELLHVTNFANRKNTNDIDINQTIDNNPPTQEQIDAGNRAKSGSSTDTPVEPTTIEGSNKKSVEVLITAANQNNPLLQIRVQVGAVESSGTCTLTLTRGGNVITKTSNIQPLASTSTCQGFDVPISELSVGSWNIKINYSSDALLGAATRDIVIK